MMCESANERQHQFNKKHNRLFRNIPDFYKRQQAIHSHATTMALPSVQSAVSQSLSSTARKVGKKCGGGSGTKSSGKKAKTVAAAKVANEKKMEVKFNPNNYDFTDFVDDVDDDDDDDDDKEEN
jgi:hypothetical protein